MSFRMQDFLCVTCGKKWEELIVAGEGRDHCGEPAQKLIGAPAVHFKTRYSAAIGKEYETPRQLEKELEKNGQWVPTAYESKQLSDLCEDRAIEDPVIGPPPDQAKILRHVEKAMERMHEDGHALFPDDYKPPKNPNPDTDYPEMTEDLESA